MPNACRNLLAEFRLLPGERIDRHFEVARHHHLHAVAVEADQLAQEVDRQEVLPAFLVLLLEDDLGQHRAGDVLVGLGVVDHEILAGLHHGGEVFERHIGAGAGVVEPPVGVFLDGDRLVGLGHALVTSPEAGAPPAASIPQAKIGGFCRAGHRFVQCATLAGTFRRTIKEPTYSRGPPALRARSKTRSFRNERRYRHRQRGPHAGRRVQRGAFRPAGP